MKRRTRIKLVYGVVFFLVGLLVGQLLPSYISFDAVLDGQPSAVGKEERGDVLVEDGKEADTKDGDPVKIGVVLPLSGERSSLGLSLHEVSEVALRDAGVENVEIVVEDSACASREMASAVQKLVAVDNVVAVVGGVCSSAVAAAIPIVDDAGVVFVSPAASGADLSGSSQYFFRTVPSNAEQVAVVNDFFMTWNVDRVGLVFADDEYGRELRNAFAARFEGEVVPVAVADVTSLADVDAVFVAVDGSADDVVMSLREVNPGVLIVGADRSVMSLEDVFVVVPDREGVQFAQFAESYESVTGEAPGVYAAEMYDAMQIVLLAVQRSDGSRESVREMVARTEGYRGASGIVSFDGFGDVSRGFEIVRVGS